MIKSGSLINLFERMKREHWTYEWGAAKEGFVDCSGAFVYAYKEIDGSYIFHGSNSIARKNVKNLLPISEAKPGMAAFKVREWTNAYKNNSWYGTEPGDVYHIGLVNRDASGVLNAKGTKYGFVESELNSNWQYVAYLNDVDYSENGGDDVNNSYGNAVVNTKSTGLRIREGANLTAKVLDTLPKGTRVNVVRDTGIGWYYVETPYIKGYVSSDYVILDDELEEMNDIDISENSVKMEVVIEDSEGRTFYPIGDFKVNIVPYSDD